MRNMRGMALSFSLSLSLLAGCKAESNLNRAVNMARPMTYQDIQLHNNWVRIQQNAVKPKAFEGQPIHVNGVGRVEATPNIAVITGLIEAASDADDIAVDKSAKIINAVQEALKDKDAALNFMNISAFEKRDEDCQKHNIETGNRHREIQQDNQHNQRIKNQIEQGVNTKTKPRKPKRRKSLKLCPVLETEARIGFVVRIAPADAAADVIKILTDSGVENIDLFGYDFDDYDALYQEAAAKAVTDARSKAELISARAGTQLLGITDFKVDAPDRTSRFGPQAIIISNHGNRSVAAGRYGAQNGAVFNSGPTVEYITTPPVFETYTETVVVQEASTELVTIPATYETVKETIVVQEASTELVTIPATAYSPARTTERTIPAITKQISRRVVRTPASTQERTIPAVTKTETRRRVKTPASTTTVVIPPSSNALKMSLAGTRTITVNASLTYRYETPIDGTLPEPETKK